MKKWAKRIGYGIGDLGCNLVFSTMASYLIGILHRCIWNYGGCGRYDDAGNKIYRCTD